MVWEGLLDYVHLLYLFISQMTVETEAARALAQQADGRIAEAEARAAAATAKCDEEMARSKELQATLGLQAHQVCGDEVIALVIRVCTSCNTMTS